MTENPEPAGEPAGVKLRRARVSLGYTQEQLEAESGVSQATLSRLERGRGEPTLRVARALSRVLRVEVDDLFLLFRL